MVDLWIHVVDAAIGLRHSSKTKKCGQKITVCLTAVELEKTLHRTIFFEKYSYVRVPLIDGGAEKKLGHSMRNNKSNDLEPHFPTSATKPRCLEDTKTAVDLPHRSESTKESIAGWWIFGLEVRLEFWRNYGP